MNAEPLPQQRKSLLASPRSDQFLVIGGSLLLFVLIFVLLLALSMGRELNHDEHQFIASATQIARQQTLPYVDFAYFHVPLLSFVYAILFQFVDQLLLSARLHSVFFAWLTLWLVFIAAYRSHMAVRLRVRLLLATLTALWLMAVPLFTYASGRAWNHDPPIFLMLLAFVVQSDLMIEKRSPYWLGASGLLMGLATTTRLSFAFAAIPFVLVLWLYPAYTGRKRWIGFGAFVLGGLLAALPTILLFLGDPAAFFFGNVDYVRLNTAYFQSLGALKGMTFADKLSYFARTFITQPGNLLLMVALLEGLWPIRRPLGERLPFVRSKPIAGSKDESLFRLAFLLLLLFFMAIGGFGATPFQPQYFFVMAPLMVLCVVYALSAWPLSIQPKGRIAFLAVAVVTILFAIPAYAPGLAIIFQPQKWEPNKVHGYGEEIGALVDDGAVLTLAPAYPLEGNISIYPEFVTGPFGWRVAPLVSADERARYGLVGPEDLAEYLTGNPPRAILVGVEKDDAEDEQMLVEYAQAHGYSPEALMDGSMLWVSQAAE